MAQIVIDIPDFLYKQILKKHVSKATIARAFQNGVVLPKGHGKLIDADKVEAITWQEPYYHDALNVLTEVRDKVRELPTIIEADKN